MNAEMLAIPQKKLIEVPLPLSHLVRTDTLDTIPQDWMPPHLAWQYSTRINNPYAPINTATGFEPYFVGQDLTAQEIREEISRMGSEMLRSLDPQNNGWRGRLLSILEHGHVAHRGPQAEDDWHLLKAANYMMGSATNRMRSYLLSNKEGQKYRDETYRLIAPHVANITYMTANGTVMEKYTLPSVERVVAPAEVPMPRGFDMRQGYELMHLLGRTVAHPALRQSLSPTTA